MISKIDGLRVSHYIFGSHKPPILLIHGWGQSHAFWNSLVPTLQKDFTVHTLDLPGFGKSQEPSRVWNVHDYAHFISIFIKSLKIENPVIMGHSYGGRLAIAYAAQFPVKKLVLYSTGGGLPEKNVLKCIYRRVIVRIFKYIIPNTLYKFQSSAFKPTSYTNSLIIDRRRSRVMLDIYTAMPELQISELAMIKTKTLIIMGDKDVICNPKNGDILTEMIVGSSLVKFSSSTHFAHLEEPKKFSEVLNSFLE